MRLTFPSDEPEKEIGPDKSLRMAPPKGEAKNHEKAKKKKSKEKVQIRRTKKTFKAPRGVVKDRDDRRATNSFFDGGAAQLFTQAFLLWIVPIVIGIYMVTVLNLDWIFPTIIGVVYAPIAINHLLKWIAKRTVITGKRHKYIGRYQDLLLKVVVYTVVFLGVVALNGLVLNSDLPEGLLLVSPILVYLSYSLWVITGLLKWTIANTIKDG